ncbi:MAG: hypothetical protein WEC36_14445, partial [Phycisphaeraceae bacterium]
MPLISRIGRRSFRTRVLFLTIYVLLIVGAVTMVYPFGIMVAGSTKSAVDASETALVPRFLRDDESLWAKHVEGLFNESMPSMQETFFADAPSFERATPPVRGNAAMVAAWQRFVRDADSPPYTYTIGYIEAPVSRITPRCLREFKGQLADQFDGEIAELNRAMATDFVTWSAFYVAREEYLLRRQVPVPSPLTQAFWKYKAQQPLGNRYYFTIEGFFLQRFIKNQYTQSIQAYNQAHGTQHASWDQMHLDRRLPTGAGRTDQERADWEQFVRTILSPLWLRADAPAVGEYRRFLRAKYNDDIAALNRNYETSHASFAQVVLIDEPPVQGVALSDWNAFIEGWLDPVTGTLHAMPIDALRIASVDFQFRDYLAQRYESIDVLNREMGTHYADWLDIRPPQEETLHAAFANQTGALRYEFVVRNFLTVFSYVFVHGRAAWNTLIYCSLAILGALLVNPLAAYALSRYKPPSAYKILLLLMLTMAFPPMVTQIPVFLMLREFNMLNTFWALVLPGIASGYAIFLLKGFFDSLPPELY